jgi:hypothetical protein
LHGFSKEKKMHGRISSPDSKLDHSARKTGGELQGPHFTTSTTDVTQLTGSHVQFGRYFLAAPITNCHTTTTALFPQRCRPSLSLQCLATYSTEIPWLYSEASEINPPALSTEWTIGGTILMTPTCCLSVRSQILPKAASKHQHKHVPVLPHGTYTRIRNI